MTHSIPVALIGRFAAVVTTVLALVGSGAGRAGAIIGGTLETAHPSAGSMVQRDDGGHLVTRCSGFLAAPTIFVTAQHCFYVFGIEDGAPAAVSFDVVVTDATVPLEGTARYNTTTGPSSDAHDVAVIELANPVTDRRPMNLPRLDELVSFQKSGSLEPHDPVRIIGSGAVAVKIPRQFTFANELRSKVVDFQTLQPGFVVLQVKDGGACFGDSGGPNLVTVGGREIVAAITRHLNARFDCATGLWSYRLYTPAARAFLGRYVALP
jgi:hypothetical protein